jgi:signal transduction histidine kinase
LTKPAEATAVGEETQYGGGAATAHPAAVRAEPMTGALAAEQMLLWHRLLVRSGKAFLAEPDGRLLFATRELAADLASLRDHFALAVRRVRDTGYEFRERIDGPMRPEMALYLPIFDEGGAMIAIAGVLVAADGEAPRNPSESLSHIALEAALEDAERRIVELETALAEARDASRGNTALFAEMSHEMRTPLNAIVGFSDAALKEIRGPLPPAYREYLMSINGAGKHLAEVTESLLDAARLEGGHLKLDMRPISARVLVAEARSMIELKAEAERVDLKAVALKHDILIETDPIRARQILVNLLGNAVKFTPPGGAIGIDAATLDESFVDLTVWDNGPGIDPTEHRRIFEAFYQVPDRGLRPSNSNGAGLGLAIARQLARFMGGDILLWSEPGRGSRFTVRLKRMRAGA